MEDNGRGRGLRDIVIWALVLAIPIGWLIFVLPQSLSSGRTTVPISQVATAVEKGMVRSITVSGDTVTVQYLDGSTVTTQKEPNETIVDALKAQGVTPSQLQSVSLEVAPPWPLAGLGSSVWIGLGLLVIAGIVLLSRQSPTSNGSDQTLSFLKSRARKIVADRPKVRFEDAAGVDEAKLELREIVEFLRTPARFTSVGARIPKGVLLVGPPGTGKTLLARAMAGEAGVPFFSISGSEFVELFVGVGASRVRDLFDQAKRHAPCIVFVDEIDAVGRQRGYGIGGGHDEREQTLNQILVEMDGFDKQTNVVVVAATNRADVLDPALLRPGRFDRRVTIDAPDVAGRRAILKIHAKAKPLDPDVDLNRIADETPGFCGADLENLMNESAILAARAGRRTISDIDVEEAVDRIVAGPERRTRLIAAQEKAITAFHEAGHAITAHALRSINQVHKVTIIPRGNSGGHTRLISHGDRQIWSRSQLLEILVVTLGGMAAEAINFGETSTGPSSDLEQATELAQRMVCEYGMSSVVGPVALRRGGGLNVDAIDTTRRAVSEMTAAEVDREIRRLVDEGFRTARKILEQRRPTLNLVAETLIAVETLQGSRLQSLLDGRPDPGPPLAASPPEEQSTPRTRLGPHRPEAAA